MSLPRWNPRWDRHEPRGGPGWSLRRYLSLLVCVLLATVFGCIFLGVWVSAAARAREQRQRVEMMNRLYQDAINEQAGREARGEK